MINRKNISDADLARLVSKVWHVSSANKINLSFFELMTIVAVLYYKEKNVDIVAVEVGRGGITDATIVMDATVAIITTISLEHTEQLGRTTSLIAQQKSGIIKKGCTTVTAVKDKSALAVIKKRCSELNSKLIVIGNHVKFTKLSSNILTQKVDFSRFIDLKNVTIHLAGAYQIQNAAVAAAATYSLNNQGFNITKSSIRRGLARAIIPGRLEIVHQKPLVILDIAHNEGAIHSLCMTVNKLLKTKVLLVVGISSDKRIPQMIKKLASISDEIIITKAPYRGADVKLLESEVKKYLSNYQSVVPVPKATSYAIKIAKKRPVIITGSLYVVKEARHMLVKS